MANITTLKVSGASHPSRAMLNTPYIVENYIDFAEVLAAKGSALASSDTVEALVVPAGTMVRAAGVQCITPDNATTLTLDLGYTGGTVDHWVDGFDHGSAAAGAYSSAPAGDGPVAPGTSADTIDLLFATLTGTLSTGVVRVWAELVDVSEKALKKPGIAQLKS
jgi:hypothetical protein